MVALPDKPVIVSEIIIQNVVLYCYHTQVDIAQKLVCGYHVPSHQIAILTPYSAQKEVINEKLQQTTVLSGIPAKTITESQGRVLKI